MRYSGMLYKSELGSAVQLMETGKWDGVRRLIDMNPKFASARGETVAELLYYYACRPRAPRSINLSIPQIGVLLLLNKSGAQINRSYPLVSYVARFDPDKESGGYFVDFPDLKRINVTAIDEGGNLREAAASARRMLADYVSFSLGIEKDLPEPRYKIRRDLKKIKQRRISVNLDDLVKAEAS